jgi:4-amino-4-deoxy-L-arabinose transferase-like glycosyltransferase
MSFHFSPSYDPVNDSRAGVWIRRLSIGFCVIAIVLGAIEAWTSRFSMNADGVQYLDNATAYSSGDFQHAVNSQWSPLYPWLIGVWLAVFRWGPYLEFPLVHLLNFIIYLLSLAGFLFFLNGVLQRIPAEQRTPSIRIGLLLIAYSSFLYCSLDFTTLAYVTPDMLVSLFAYLAAGLLLGIAEGRATVSRYVALGAVLGMGYLAKTPFLIFGVLCLGMLVVLGRKRPAALVRWSLAVAIFAAIAVPYIWILSNAKSRFTFGDSGRWNVIWMVNGVPYYNWQGGPPDNGTPIHPTRQLSSNPAIFEFATPVAGTYPPWYDPIYWTEGAKIVFRPANFAHALLQQIRLYRYLIHHRQLPFVFAMASLFLLSPDKSRIVQSMRQFWPVFFLGATPFAMYALVHADGRFLAAFFVLLWTVLTASLLVALNDSLDPRVLLGILTVAAALMVVEAAIVTPAATGPARQHYEIAERTQALGLKRGDRVAIVSGDLDYFWARLAGARVSMQVDFGQPACLNGRKLPAEWAKAKQILAASGVVLVVSPCIPGVVDQPGWQKLGATGAFAYRFP